MLINRFKIMFFTALCFVFISCTVDVNQPVKVEEVYSINAKEMFDSLVNHIGWRTSNSRLLRRGTPAEGESPYVDLAIMYMWEFTDNAILDDLEGQYKIEVYIQGGQEDKIKDAALSNNHRIGRQKKLYWANGAWAIQNVTGQLSFVYSRFGGSSWNSEERKFVAVDPYFGGGEIIVFGNNLSLLNASYTLEPIEEKERIINMTYVDHG